MPNEGTTTIVFPLISILGETWGLLPCIDVTSIFLHVFPPFATLLDVNM